jgi:hypothetical protein
MLLKERSQGARPLVRSPTLAKGNDDLDGLTTAIRARTHRDTQQEEREERTL